MSVTETEDHFISIIVSDTWITLFLMQFIQDIGSNFSYHESHMELIPVKFLILILSLVSELQIMEERAEFHTKVKRKSAVAMQQSEHESSSIEAISIYEKFANHFCFTLV